MKIAVISDVHGNIAALEAVLEHIARQQVAVTVNLGDILSGSLFPVECAERLMPLALPSIRGNHERQLLSKPAEALGISDAFAAERLRTQDREWIAALPETIRLTSEVLMIHGTPASDLELMLETVTATEGLRAATAAEIAARAEGIGFPLLLCGHSHLPGAYTLSDGRLIVNPGSVGLQAYTGEHPFPHKVETGSPHARYAVVEKTNGTWHPEFFQLEYDWESMAQAAELHERPDWVRPLRTGRV
jgi:putative phosphoesterase